MQTHTSEHIAWILKTIYIRAIIDFSFVHTWEAERERKLQSGQNIFSAHVQDVHICFATAAFTKSNYCEDICLRGGTCHHTPFQASSSCFIHWSIGHENKWFYEVIACIYARADF